MMRNISRYKNMTSEDQRTFDRWLKTSAVVGSIFAAALVGMAIVESNALGPREAGAQSTAASAVRAVAIPAQRSGVLLAYTIVY